MPDCFCSGSGSRSQEVADVRLLKCAGFGGLGVAHFKQSAADRPRRKT